jgi:protein ImuB
MGRAPMTKPVELYACLYAKEFPAQTLLRLRPGLRNKPCAVIEGEPPVQYLCSCNAKARNLGVAHGMTRVEMDTFPSVAVLPRSHAEEEAAKAALLECAGTFSPRVEDRSKGNVCACVLDISGTEKLFGPPAALAKRLFESIQALGIVASVAVSGNFHAALCLARSHSSRRDAAIIPSGNESTALSSLPLTVLDLSQEQAETFSLWGIHTLGMLADLPEKELIARMGQKGKQLRQLACGVLPHLLQPVEPAFSLEERMELDAPVELLDSLLFVMGVMLEQLILRAIARVLALESVTIDLALEDRTAHTRTVRPALPTNDRRLWIKLLHLELEAHPPQAAILALTLRAVPGSISKVQLGLFSPQLPEPARLDVTLARIRAIVGEDCVGRAVLKDTHQPDGFRMEPFTVPAGPASEGAPSRPRPAARQLRPAENVAVIFNGRRLEAFFFREKRYAVDHAYGPWLTGGDWWSPAPWDLEQWDLVARSREGAVLCCCLTHERTQNCWRMAALYD